MSSPTVTVNIAVVLESNGADVSGETIDLNYKLSTDSTYTAATPATTNSTGTARFALQLMAPDVYDFEALFNGDTIYAASSATSSFDTTAIQQTTDTTCAVSSSHLVTGMLETSASSMALPSQSIAISDNGTNIANVQTQPDGSYSYQLAGADLDVGSHSIVASFAGTAIYLASSGTANYTITNPPPPPAPTSIQIAVTELSSASSTASVQISATLTSNGAAVPNQSVAFQYALGSGAYVSAGSATTNSSGVATIDVNLNAPDVYSIQALFAGTSAFDSSSNTVTFDTTATLTTTTIAISVDQTTYVVSGTLTSAGSPLAGQPISLTDNGTTLTNLTTASDGTFSYQIPSPAVGANTIEASFAGNGTYASSTASTTLTINANGSYGGYGFNPLSIIDSINEGVYNILSAAPLLGPLTPPPPKLAG